MSCPPRGLRNAAGRRTLGRHHDPPPPAPNTPRPARATVKRCHTLEALHSSQAEHPRHRARTGRPTTSASPHLPPPPAQPPRTTPVTRTHPREGTQPEARQGDTRTGPPPPPPTLGGQSKGPGRETRRGTDHLERPYRRPARPREVRTQKGRGRGGVGDAAGARAHNHTTGTPRAPEGHPDQARGTRRPGMAYQ